MPLNRRMLAADMDLAEKLAAIAHKHGSSLYSLTNRLIEAYTVIEKLGYKDPMDAAIDLVLYTNMINTGFRITPPEIEGDGWERLGESLWLLISMEKPEIDPIHAMIRLASLLLDERSVFIDTGEETRVVVSIPVGSPVNVSALRGLLKGFAGEALKGRELKLEHKSNIVMLRIKNKKS